MQLVFERQAWRNHRWLGLQKIHCCFNISTNMTWNRSEASPNLSPLANNSGSTVSIALTINPKDCHKAVFEEEARPTTLTDVTLGMCRSCASSTPNFDASICTKLEESSTSTLQLIPPTPLPLRRFGMATKRKL